MQRVTLSIPCTNAVAGDAFQAFVNADAAGRRVASIDYTRPIGGPSPTPFFPLGGAVDAAAVRTIESPRLLHGWYDFAVRTQDAVGNVTEDAATFKAFVSSGPRPCTNVRHSSTTVDGRPVFAFSPPAMES